MTKKKIVGLNPTKAWKSKFWYYLRTSACISKLRFSVLHSPFPSFLPLKCWQTFSLCTRSETQKDHLIVKTTKRRHKFLSYLKNLESFLVVTSVAMRFFRNAARSTSKNKLLVSIRRKRLVWRARSWEGAPKKTSSWRRSRVRAKKRFKKMTSEVPEIKLVKLLKFL